MKRTTDIQGRSIVRRPGKWWFVLIPNWHIAGIGVYTFLRCSCGLAISRLNTTQFQSMAATAPSQNPHPSTFPSATCASPATGKERISKSPPSRSKPGPAEYRCKTTSSAHSSVSTSSSYPCTACNTNGGRQKDSPEQYNTSQNPHCQPPPESPPPRDCTSNPTDP